MRSDPRQSGEWLPYDPGLASPPAARLHDYWASKKTGPDDLPSREDIRPEEIKALLPHVWIMDLDRATGTFRYRLIGTAVVDGVGRDYTGRTLAECGPNEGVYETATGALLRLIEEARPIWRRGRPMFHHHSAVRTLENVALPLAADRRTADRILGMTVFYDSDGRIYLPGVLRTT